MRASTQIPLCRQIMHRHNNCIKMHWYCSIAWPPHCLFPQGPLESPLQYSATLSGPTLTPPVQWPDLPPGDHCFMTQHYIYVSLTLQRSKWNVVSNNPNYRNRICWMFSLNRLIRSTSQETHNCTESVLDKQKVCLAGETMKNVDKRCVDLAFSDFSKIYQSKQFSSPPNNWVNF